MLILQMFIKWYIAETENEKTQYIYAPKNPFVAR